MSNFVRFSLSPVCTDAILYMLIATFMFMQSYLSSDEAAKYVAPATLFWVKFYIGALGAGIGALKMFRSTTFADHQRDAISTATK